MMAFTKINKNYFRIIFEVLILCAGITLGLIINKPDEPQTIESVRETSSSYKFINPLLFVKVPEDPADSEYSSLKKIIGQYVENVIDQKKVSEMSVYYRNLNTSQWISINPEETFYPASMLKVATLISVLRVAESDPHLLSRTVSLNGDDSFLKEGQTKYQSENPVKSGYSYTIKELVDRLAIDSDNAADNALQNIVGENKILKTYHDLKLPEPGPRSQGNTYTAREYSHLWRALYNGTYLSRTLSEQVLELLSRTKFTQGLVAGVPADIVVSHKFGVRTVLTDNSSTSPLYRELHDCGIVYNKNAPYFICVMTRGNDFDTLESVIKDISKITWDHISNLNSQ
ncbi:MAG: class A beta-lactamase-related serine hydrolase [Candidatus Vogelbacteria bacterium]|nr:class A beta-lactamase-related serine hydrolase [Candidatus Vogelbacteria bacterium]